MKHGSCSSSTDPHEEEYNPGQWLQTIYWKFSNTEHHYIPLYKSIIFKISYEHSLLIDNKQTT